MKSIKSPGGRKVPFGASPDVGMSAFRIAASQVCLLRSGDGAVERVGTVDLSDEVRNCALLQTCKAVRGRSKPADACHGEREESESGGKYHVAFVHDCEI